MRITKFGFTKQLLRIRIKEYLRSMIAVSMILSVLMLTAGCASDSGSNEDESFMQKYEAPSEKLERTSLKFYFPGTQPKNWPNVRAEIEKRSADTVNASLDFKWVDFGQYFTQMKALDAAGEVFDAFCLAKPDSNYPDFTSLAREKKLADITSLFPDNAQSLYSKYSRQELDFAKIDGKLYAVPSLSPSAYCTYLMVDDALYKKYKIPEIKNLDQYEAYLKAVKDNNPDLVPGAITNGIDSMKLFARAFGYVILDEFQNLVYKWDDPKMTVKAWEQTPEFLEASNKIADWYGKGYLKGKSDLKGDADLDPTKITSFVYYGQLSPPSEETQRMTYTDAAGKMKQSNPLRAFYLYPEKKIQRDNPMGSFFYNGSFVFPAVSSNTARALRFLDWVQQNHDNYYLMMYGIENEDYVTMGGYPAFPSGQDFSNRSYLYWDGNWALRNISYDPAPPKDAYGTGINTYRDFLDKYTAYAPHGAFYPDYGKLKDMAAQRSQAIQLFEMKQLNGQIKDTAEVNKFIGDMKQLGIDNLVAEIQSQLDKK